MSKFIKIECVKEYPNPKNLPENPQTEIVILNTESIYLVIEESGYTMIYTNYPKRKAFITKIKLEELWTKYLER